MSTTCLALVPRDALFMKDGRGFYTSEAGRGHGHAWPQPPTLRGALRAALGRAIMQTEGQALAREAYDERTRALTLDKLVTLYRPRKDLAAAFRKDHRIWPTPADAFYSQVGETVSVLRLLPEAPRAQTLGPTDNPALEALYRPYPSHRGKPALRPLFWSDAAMMSWLCDDEPTSSSAGLSPTRRTQIHVTMDANTSTATPSMLFSEDLLETTAADGSEWALGVACRVPEGASLPSGPMTLGSKRRLAMQERIEPSVFAAPEGLFTLSRGLRLVLTTPAHFRRGVVPDQFEANNEHQYVGDLPGVSGPVLLRAALVPGVLDLSGWDMAARQPRKTRRLVPAGAVYFFEKQNGESFTPNEKSALWLARWGLDTEDGLGQCLPGRWNPESKGR